MSSFCIHCVETFASLNLDDESSPLDSKVEEPLRKLMRPRLLIIISSLKSDAKIYAYKK